MASEKINGVVKQSHALGAFWGNLKMIAQHTNVYIQLLILGFSGIGAYGVLGKWALDIGFELRFWQFVLVVGLIIGIVMLFEWRFGVPSSFISWNQQWWEHCNPMRKEIDEIKKKLDEIREAQTK